MNLRFLFASLAFASALTAALPASADVAPDCEACILHNEGDVCGNGDGTMTCQNDSSAGCLICLPKPATDADAGADAGAGGDGSGGTESGGGCSTGGAVGITWALWAVAAVPLLYLGRRRRNRR